MTEIRWIGTSETIVTATRAVPTYIDPDCRLQRIPAGHHDLQLRVAGGGKDDPRDGAERVARENRARRRPEQGSAGTRQHDARRRGDALRVPGGVLRLDGLVERDPGGKVLEAGGRRQQRERRRRAVEQPHHRVGPTCRASHVNADGVGSDSLRLERVPDSIDVVSCPALNVGSSTPSAPNRCVLPLPVTTIRPSGSKASALGNMKAPVLLLIPVALKVGSSAPVSVRRAIAETIDGGIGGSRSDDLSRRIQRERADTGVEDVGPQRNHGNPGIAEGGIECPGCRQPRDRKGRNTAVGKRATDDRSVGAVHRAGSG